MTRQKKVIVEEIRTSEEGLSLERDNNLPKNKEFKAEFNSDEGIVSFELTDGTFIQMKSPKTRQFLLLESFMKQSPEEYKTEAFLLLKLASLCINKFGDKLNITFDELIDTLEFEDVERLASAISFFQNKFEYLSKSVVH